MKKTTLLIGALFVLMSSCQNKELEELRIENERFPEKSSIDTTSENYFDPEENARRKAEIRARARKRNMRLYGTPTKAIGHDVRTYISNPYNNPLDPEEMTKYDKGINWAHINSAQDLEDHRANNKNEETKLILGYITMVIGGGIFIFMLNKGLSYFFTPKRITSNNEFDIDSTPEEEGTSHRFSIPIDKRVSKKLNDLEPSKFNSSLQEKRLINQYSYETFDVCFNHISSPGITSNVLSQMYYTSILPRGKKKNYQSALELLNYRNETLQDLFSTSMPIALQEELASRYSQNISLILYAQCYFEGELSKNNLFYLNINELIYKCIEIRHNQNCVFEKDEEYQVYDIIVLDALQHLVSRYV